jgi:hypothetical protein
MCATRLTNLNPFDITILIISGKEYYYRAAAMYKSYCKYQTQKQIKLQRQATSFIRYVKL